MIGTRQLLALAAILSFGLCLDFPNIPTVCDDMTPASTTTEPQTLPPPFRITVNKYVYKSGETLNVNLATTNGEKIVGFMIAAKLYDPKVPSKVYYGALRTSDVPTVTICNSAFGNALIHGNLSNFEPRSSLNFAWASYPSTQGHLVFKATVVFSPERYWVGEPSEIVIDETSPKPPSPISPTSPPSTDSIEISQCGKTRGCYRNPPGCNPSDCEVLVTWLDHGDGVDFQMTGDTSGWVSVAFSEDTKPGKDEVFECLWNETSKQVEIKHLRTREDPRTVVMASPLSLSNKIGFRNNRRITCFFKKDKLVPGQNNQFLNEDRYLLLSKGRADKMGKKLIHEQEANKYPYVSPEQIKTSDKVDLSGTIRYPLVKAHACMMILGWMLCFMLALMLSKYYRPMWPNTRWCGKRVWYTGYMALVALALFFTVIGFILIFVHASGYVELNIYPDKAHPPIGICVTILIVLIFLLAFCRPTDPDKRSPFGVCINWFLWLFETAASVLATINIFIGLNLQKAHVPWWATWVVAAFFLFHLIVELILEIHGCLNSKKEEFHKQEYEKHKRGGLEREPVGKNFKNRTIVIYLFVSTILCFVAVIGIATG